MRSLPAAGAGSEPEGRLPKAPRLARDTRGGVIVEYTVLLGLVGVASITVMLAIGLSLVSAFDAARTYVLLPLP